MALTTLFGTAQLALQEALASNLDTSGPTPRVPNFIIVSLRRDTFVAEHRGPIEEERVRFRRGLEEAAGQFMTAHAWRAAGTGALTLNVVFRSTDADCTVQARVVQYLYELSIRDDRGQRTVQVKANPAIIGRAHDGHPRGFIEVHDDARLISREHLMIRYADLALTVQLLGRNTTTLNGATLGTDPVPLHRGDVVECGRCRIEVAQL
jgi:hypothetical protein